jgi:hypothetical protein
MFPWKDFLMEQFKKIKKHKEKRDRLGNFKKEGKNGGKKYIYIFLFYVP